MSEEPKCERRSSDYKDFCISKLKRSIAEVAEKIPQITSGCDIEKLIDSQIKCVQELCRISSQPSEDRLQRIESDIKTLMAFRALVEKKGIVKSFSIGNQEFDHRLA